MAEIGGCLLACVPRGVSFGERAFSESKPPPSIPKWLLVKPPCACQGARRGTTAEGPRAKATRGVNKVVVYLFLI